MTLSIWQSRGFTAYLFIAFFNAFTDLGHKIIIQNALFKVLEGTELRIYTAIIQTLILLPYIMIFSPAGYFSDKYPKHRIIQIAAFVALPITALITVCYYLGEFWLAFWLTLALGLQSAFYSPAKYGYIRELLGKEKLAAGNSAVQAVTIIAILAGTLAYSVLFEFLLKTVNYTSLEDILVAVRYAGYVLVGGTLLEFALTLRLPQRAEANTAMRFEVGTYLRLGYLRQNLRTAWNHQGIRLSIIGLSVFFALNQVILATFGAHLKAVTGETDTSVANGLMALGGVGIVLGSIYAGRVSRNYIETGIIPLGALGMFVSLAVLPGLTSLYSLALVFTLYGFFGGLFIVPLNALIQYHAKEGESGVILAGNNFVQNVFMLLFLLLSIGLAYAELSNQSIFYLLAAVTLIGALYALSKLPQSFIRYLVGALITHGYRVQVVGMKNLPAQGGVLLLGNHVSWLDWAILQIASPRPLRFVMYRGLYERWYLRWFLDLFQVIPISAAGGKEALETVREALERGEAVALFPEGHISHNGHLSLFKSGFERAVQDTHAVIVPFYLRGLWGSRFSYVSRHYRETSRDGGSPRRVVVGFGAPVPPSASAAEVKQAVLQTSIHTWQEYAATLSPLPHSFLRTAVSQRGQLAVVDGNGEMTYRRLLTAVLAFRRKLGPLLAGQANVGILLPSSGGAVIANLAVMLHGKTVVNLNYTASPQTVGLCMEKAGIRTVLSSRLFLKKLEARGFDATPLQTQARFVLLEDVKQELGKGALLAALLQASLLPLGLLRRLYCAPVKMDDTAAILFSSGSEGVPKGGELSHTNIMCNLKQAATLLNLTEDDVMLNSLPIFHAFGLTVTTLLPLIEGLPQVCQPDPTDARAVGQLCARYRVTLMCATSTFLRLYTRNRKLHPLMFESMRLIIAGAERLSPEVRAAFKERFNQEIYEGYGATETSPVACVNIPDILLSYSGEIQVGNKHGTVGLPLPGTQIRIVDPTTLQDLPVGEAGLVLIGGIQVMKGYLDDPAKTAEAVFEQDGVRWYKSGDKGRLDEDGYLSILDRYSRFAKIGGEMVSLGAVETALAAVIADPDTDILAVALPDPGKGERVVLLVAGGVGAEEVKRRALQAGLNPLMLPKDYYGVEAIPRLGSGKADFTSAKKLAQSLDSPEA